MSTSNAAVSTSQNEERTEAGPLPRKRGELGYVASADGELNSGRTGSHDAENPLPARHPADRDHQPSTESTGEAQSSQQSSQTQSTPNAAPASTSSVPTKRTFIERLSWQGIQFPSLLRIFLLLLFLGGTAAAWAITIRRFESQSRQDPSNEDDNNSNSPESDSALEDDGKLNLPSGFSSLVFVHVAFTVIILFEILFLERALYHARAERYMFKHGMARNTSANATVGLAPWNRLPLPTYAAALAESGGGSGDVEDGLIAIPPPPAYGNTRGSVLLLSSFLPNALTRTFSRSSASSRQGSPETQMEEGRRGRPISYGASEEIVDARRAMQLELALQKLEDGHPNPGRNQRPATAQPPSSE